MPIFFFKEINETTKLAIWKIEETEDFFLKHVPLLNTIKHPHKRLQHLAGRYLLQWLFPDFPMQEIEIADTRKPFIRNEQYHFSISHSGNYAAAIVSSSHRLGIDLESKSDKIAKIAHKFLHQNEIEAYRLENINEEIDNASLSKLTILWSAKEAIYKWWGKGGVDFKEMINISAMKVNNRNNLFAVFKGTSPEKYLTLSYLFNDDVCIVWVVDKV